MKQILYFIDIVILLILFIFKVIKLEKKEKKNKKQLIIKWVTGVIGLIIFCIIGVQYIENGKQLSYNKDMQIRKSTIFGYHIYDFESAANIKRNSKYKNFQDMIICARICYK